MKRLYMGGIALLALVIASGVSAKEYVLYNRADEPISYEWYGYTRGAVMKDKEDYIGSLKAGEHVLLANVKPWSNAGTDYFRTEGSYEPIDDFGLILKDSSGAVIFKGAPSLENTHSDGRPYAIAYVTTGTPAKAKLQHGKLEDTLRLGSGVYWSPEQKEDILTTNGYGLVVQKIKNGVPFLDKGWSTENRSYIQKQVRTIGANERSDTGEATPLRRPTNVEVAAVYPEGGDVGKPIFSVRNYYDDKKDQSIVLVGPNKE